MIRTFLLLCLMAATAFAQGAPATVSFTARLQDNGLPLMGAHDFVFSLYDSPTGGTQKYTQTVTQQPIGEGGMLYLDLGPFSATTHFTGPALYLEITIDGQVTSPRILIESVPYSLRSGKASDADGMGGVPATSWQRAVNSTCSGATDSIKTINQDGSVTCYTGATYTNGTGLLLAGGVFSVDPTVYQQRVKACATGAMSAIAQDGTPTCVPIPNYTAGTGISINTNTIAVDYTTVNCASGSLFSSSASGTPTCYSAGTGLTFGTGAWNVDTTVIQKRVTVSCTVGQTVTAINADGSVTCGPSVSVGFGAAANSGTRSSTSYGTLGGGGGAGPSVTVVIPASGNALVTLTGNLTPSAGGTAYMAFNAPGSNASDSLALIKSSTLVGESGSMQASATYYVTGLTPGASQTFTAVYKSDSNSSTATFSNRQIIVHPLP